MKAYLLKESSINSIGNDWSPSKSWPRCCSLTWKDLSYCRVPVRFGVVEAINGNIKALLRLRRGYKNLRYLLLKAQRLAAFKTEFLVLRKAA